MIVWLEKRGGF